MRSLEWILVQSDCCSYEKGTFGHMGRHAQMGGIQCEETQREFHVKMKAELR